MKLSFSTLGCPDWSFSEIFSTAKDLGFDGIEVRGIANELYVPHAKRFRPDKIDGTIAKLKAGNITIPIITSGIALGMLETDAARDTAIAEAKEYIDLASKLNCPYIRLMATASPQPEPFNRDDVVRLYNEICEYGADKGVMPLIETNGDYASSDACVELMNSIKSPNKGILWDVHHPYRYFGEQPEQTVQKLGSHIKHVHVKDSVVKDGKLSYRMMGYGDVPVFDALKSLKAMGYDGYVSLEWVKRWNPELEEAGIVFAHFISYMQFLMQTI